QYVDRRILRDVLEIVLFSRSAKNVTLRFSKSRLQAHVHEETRALAKRNHSLQRSRKRLNLPKFVCDFHTSPPIQPRTAFRMHIGDKHRAAGPEHLSDLAEELPGVFDVTQNKIAQNQVRRTRFDQNVSEIGLCKSCRSSQLTPRDLQHLNRRVHAEQAPRPHALKLFKPSAGSAAQVRHV